MPEQTLALRRYVLGLTLVAAYRASTNLSPPRLQSRAGSLTIPKKVTLVNADGTRGDLKITHDHALAYAKTAAKEFGVGESMTVKFDPNLAKKDIAGKAT